MADLLVRGLEEKALRRLKAQARRAGRSLEAEARLVLSAAAPLDAGEALSALARFRRRFGGRRFPDSAALIRAERNA